MANTVDLKHLFETPDLFIKSIDWQSHEACIVSMSQETYRESNFLDQRTITTGLEVTINLDELCEAFNSVKPTPKPLNFIFHTAFCGSTLLTRCLEECGTFMAYREPLILHQLACAGRNGKLKLNDHERYEFIRLLLAILGRTFERDVVPVIKPSDSSLNIAHDLLTVHQDSKALLLYTPLPDFVVTMLKLPSRRNFVRGMLYRAKKDLQAHGFKSIDDRKLSDAQVAGIVWLGLIVPYLSLLRDHTLNVRSLDTRLLYKSPVQTLTATCNWFGTNPKIETLRRVVNNGAFTRQAKNTGQKFDRESKAIANQQHHLALQSEIDEATNLVKDLTKHERIPVILPASLEIALSETDERSEILPASSSN